ncbi:unnamed protein product [Mytilus edulis]|uniref:Uncharacterized protein n=1 Tax=Mytilus edulis TaxID=6550 RepID=A0A8S3TJI4_MYTED|nr:unnamed protein product [Mytilus edulis]
MDKSIVNFSKTSISDLNKINAITSMTNAGNFTVNDNLSVAVTESDNGTYESNDEVINLQCTDTNVLCNPPEALSPVDFKLCFSIGLSVLVTACLFALLNNNCYELPNLQETSEGKDNVYDFSLTKGIKICSHNVNRLEHKLDEIKYNLMFSENPPDIYCCCETFLDSNTQDNFIQIPGFILNRKDRLSRGGGGLVAYFSEKVTFNRKAEFEISDIETMWFEIKPVHKKSFYYV